MNGAIALLPAYGREYKDIESALKDWDAGKDFQILGGPYCSIRDTQALRREFHTVILAISGKHHVLW